MKKPLLLVLSLLFSITLLATETTIVVRAKAKDAKFIGTSMGGARVVIKNSLTGEILAEGITSGSTGSTQLIMQNPHQRGVDISNEETAKFEVVIDIEEPVFATVEVYGPLNEKQALANASTQLWLLPGKDITGDGIVLELPGFVVDILSPTHQSIISGKQDNRNLIIKAKVVMMCGCTITNGGMWNAEEYEVQALIKSNGKVVETVPLLIRDTASVFEGEATVPANSHYKIIVSAYDAETGNTGIDKTGIAIQ